MGEIGGNRKKPNPAGELARAVLGQLFRVSGLPMAPVGVSSTGARSLAFSWAP